MDIDFDRGRWAPATRQAYKTFWAAWSSWCAGREIEPFPSDPKLIAAFLTERAKTLATASVASHLAAILAINALYDNMINTKATVIRDAWAEIRRSKGIAKKPKEAIEGDNIRKVINGIPHDQLQDRAIILFGFSSAMRRSELVALNRDDIEFKEDGATVYIRHSKTDKSGQGEHIAIPRSDTKYCAVAALERWLQAAEITEGPIFRNKQGGRLAAREIANVTKKWAANIGFDPRDVGAHSLRRGCISTMHKKGIDLKSGMEHSRHRTPTIYLGYVQADRALKNPALKALKL